MPSETVGALKFCERCGSYMEKARDGFTCPRCGNRLLTASIEIGRREESLRDPVYVVDSTQMRYIKVNHECPECGNNEAYRLVSVSSGEHAGVKQERTVEHYRCTRCLHSWSES